MKQISYCSNCGCQLPNGIKTCPNCGKKVKRKKGCLSGVLLIVGVLAAIGIIGNSGDSSPDGNASVESISKSTPTEALSVSDFNPGEIEEQVIYEGNDVRIIAKKIEESRSGYNINLYIENNSSLNLDFNARAYGVNGIMTGDSIYSMRTEVAAGKKANTSLDLDNKFFSETGISDIRCVDILLWAYDDDKSYKAFDTAQLEIKTNLYDETHDVISGETIYNADNIKIDYWYSEGNKYYYLISNATGEYFSFDVDGLNVNDFTITDVDYDLMDVIVLDKSQAVVAVEVDSDFLTTNSIDKIESIEWSMSVRPHENYSDEYKIGPIVDKHF